ncbi:hypothetical protein AC578_3626 [Pseudocercospora eumusae]|uniref:N-acetyltransferase domain-containing protein n=1 Tax=Pseudocercospora eumusae TaxID=321146 RepID=A0A139HPR6_9PEZI|nr:hypothetical protein AC578_3626 [Pseudocercospora eumusae]
MASSKLPIKTWDLTSSDTIYKISTDPSLLDHDFINKAFASEHMPWARPMSAEVLQSLLANSLTFGLYASMPNIKPPTSAQDPDSPRTPSPTLESDESIWEQIGMARLVTDHVTVLYFTDMYIDPAYQRRGLGRWTVKCIREQIQELPVFRTLLLLTSDPKAREMYEKELNVKNVVDRKDGIICMTRSSYEE